MVGDQRELIQEHSSPSRSAPPAAPKPTPAFGFDDLGTCLAHRYTRLRWPQWRISEEIGLSQARISRLLRAHKIRASVNILPGRRHHDWARAKLGGRLTALGFKDLDGYLLDRYRDRGYRIGDLQAELSCGSTCCALR